MRVLQGATVRAAKAALTTALLGVALAGCGKDSNAPSTFNPDGATADVSAMHEAFAAPAVASFGAAGVDISAALNGAGAVSASSGLITAPSKAARFAGALAGLLRPAGAVRISASAGAIPTEALGKVYVWSSADASYVVSDRAGAPSNGVRFVLYAVNPATGKPAEPLNELGYADVIDASSGSSISWRVTVVSGAVTYLDYAITGTPTSQGGIVTISGFATDGSRRANFTLKNTIVETSSALKLTLDYKLDVPSRNLAFDYVTVLDLPQSGPNTLTLDLTMAGPNGTVNLSGTGDAAGGTYTVKVNGDLFATITADGSGTPTVTGASGAALTPAEEETLRTIFGWYEESGDFLEDLLDPVV